METNLEQAKLAEAEILAECDRLGGAIPYGVCAQTPLATLRALKSPAEARAFYRQWREIGAVTRVGATDLIGS